LTGHAVETRITAFEHERPTGGLRPASQCSAFGHHVIIVENLLACSHAYERLALENPRAVVVQSLVVEARSENGSLEIAPER
jgi:hypothetical protein